MKSALRRFVLPAIFLMSVLLTAILPHLLVNRPGIGSAKSLSQSILQQQKSAMALRYSADVDCLPTANYYQLQGRLKQTKAAALIEGEARIRYTNRNATPLEQVVFRLYPNAASTRSVARLQVTQVQVQAHPRPIQLSVEETVLTVPLRSPLLPGATVEITLNFVTQIQANRVGGGFGRMGYIDQVITAASWYPTLSVYEAGRGWWVAPLPPPIVDQTNTVISDSDPTYSESSFFDVALRLPRALVLVTNGTQTRRQEHSDGTVTYHSVTGPMREQVFVASPRYVVTSLAFQGIQLHLWHYGDRASTSHGSTRQIMDIARKALTAFRDRFGVYPYQTLHIVQNPIDTGLEFPGLILVSDQSWEQGTAERIVVHEIAHQWFYGLLGNNQVEHPWLDEGLATYSEFVYTIYHATPKVAQQLTRAEQAKVEQFTQTIAQKQRPDLKLNLSVAEFQADYGSFAYQRGGQFYLWLEQQLGREIVYRALKHYVQRQRYEVTTTKDLKQALERSSGKDLTAPFEQWVGTYQEDAQPAPLSQCQPNL